MRRRIWNLIVASNSPGLINPDSTSKAHILTRYSRKTDNFEYFWWLSDIQKSDRKTWINTPGEFHKDENEPFFVEIGSVGAEQSMENQGPILKKHVKSFHLGYDKNTSSKSVKFATGSEFTEVRKVSSTVPWPTPQARLSSLRNYWISDVLKPFHLFEYLSLG